MKVFYQETAAKKSYPQLKQLKNGSVFCFANDTHTTPYILIEGDALDDIYTGHSSLFKDYIIGADYDEDLSIGAYRPIIAMDGELFFTSRFNEVIPLNATMVIEGEETI